jgi:hypothetical protein
MTPLIVLAAGALVVSAAVIAGVHRRASRRSGVVVRLQPPHAAALVPDDWVRLFRSLFGVVRPWWRSWLLGQPWIAFEYQAAAGETTMRCWFPPELEGLVTTFLRTTLPRVAVIADEMPTRLPRPAARSRLMPWRDWLFPLGQPRAEALRGVLDVLSAAPHGVVQLAISPDRRWEHDALRRLDELAGIPSSEPLPLRLLSAAVGVGFELVWSGPAKAPSPEPRSHTNPLPPSDKATQPGFRTEIRLRVAAPTRGLARRRMQALAAAFRALDGGNGLRSTRVWWGRRFDAAIVRHHPPRAGAPVLVANELAVLVHLPVPGSPIEPAHARLAPSRLPAAAGGKVICLADDERRTPAVLTPVDGRHHVHVLGPIGSGKSTLLLNLALDDIDAGRGVAVIDPEGDLVRDLLERIERDDWDRVRLIDPSAAELPVGLNVLACEDPDLRELVADQTVTIFRKLWERWWGPRTEDVLRAAVLTLLHQREATICEVPLLLLRPQSWQHVLGRVDDPVGLGPWWREYLQVSEAQRLQMAGALLYKLRAVLLRRSIRNILGQPRSTIDLAEVMDGGGILLVSLAKGLLGEETSRLMGSFLFARLWQTALARADRPESRRLDFTIYADEFWSYLHMPQNLGDVLVQARKYRLGLVLANQHLGQLGQPIRESLIGNARTRVVFQLGQDDAQHLAREFEPLTAHDLRSLQAHQVAVRLCVDAHTESPFTGTSRPAPSGRGEEHARALVRAALERYGRPRALVEAEIMQQLGARGLPPLEEAA